MRCNAEGLDSIQSVKHQQQQHQVNGFPCAYERWLISHQSPSISLSLSLSLFLSFKKEDRLGDLLEERETVDLDFWPTDYYPSAKDQAGRH